MSSNGPPTLSAPTPSAATLPAQEGLYDIGTHFTHLPLEPLPDSLKRKRKGNAKEPERKSSAVVFPGREESVCELVS